MTVHLIKMAVGIEDVLHLAAVQEQRRETARARGEPPLARHLTRNTPRRADEVLEGGSIYWVIRGYIQARQRVVGLERASNPEGLPRCALSLDERLVRTVPRRCRAFQGWRYLEPPDAPADIPDAEVDTALPSHMIEELRALGLI